VKTPKQPKIVAYYRVSTRKQYQSGLGLEAQQNAVQAYAEQHRATVLAEYTEVETGKRHDIRPKLQEAVAHAKLARATLVIAKLDRLARNVAFVANLQESGVEFICCDNPTANRLTVHILAAVAESEAMATSTRTKDALAAAKRRGVKLGSARPEHWKGREHKRGWKKATKAAASIRTRRTEQAYAFLIPKMLELRQQLEAEAKEMHAQLHQAMADIKAEWDPQIRRAKAAVVREEPGSQAKLDKLLTQRAARVQAASEKYSCPVYVRIADWLNSQGHLTTMGTPFTNTTVFRILQRAEKQQEDKLATT
jgi:DNA invertase Pin-like site-specific DNA recombinase